MSGTETIVALATSKSISLRTTIPTCVVKKMGLEEGDHIDWDIDKNGQTWVAMIIKKGSGQ